MIHPTCLEVLATVQTTFSRDIVPKLDDIEARSAAATIEHLLRHVALRIEHEGEFLTTDIARLSALLSRAADWMGSRGADNPGSVRDLLAGEERAVGSYRSLEALGSAALALRGALVEVQELLHARDEGDSEAADIHEAVREYIGLQLTDEAKLIEPAFSGQGPRR